MHYICTNFVEVKRFVLNVFLGFKLKAQGLSKLIQNTIAAAVMELPVDSETRRHLELCVGQDSFLVDVQDWSDLGDLLKNKFHEIRHGCTIELAECCLSISFHKLLFLARQMGQDMLYEKKEPIIDTVFFNWKVSEGLELVVHNAFDISSSDVINNCVLSKSRFTEVVKAKLRYTFYPLLGLQDIGNIQGRPLATSSIKSFQIYTRWCNFLKENQYKFFTQPVIARMLAGKAKLLFDVNWNRQLQLDRKEAEKLVMYPSIAASPTNMVKRLISMLNDKLWLRFEVAQSFSDELEHLKLQDIINRSFDLAEKWISEEIHPEKIILHVARSAIHNRASDLINPCLENILEGARKVELARRAKCLLSIPSDCYWSQEFYWNLALSEAAISFYLQGNSHIPSSLKDFDICIDFLGFRNPYGVLTASSTLNTSSATGKLCATKECAQQVIPLWINDGRLKWRKQLCLGLEAYQALQSSENLYALAEALCGYVSAELNGCRRCKEGIQGLFHSSREQMNEGVPREVASTAYFIKMLLSEYTNSPAARAIFETKQILDTLIVQKENEFLKDFIDDMVKKEQSPFVFQFGKQDTDESTVFREVACVMENAFPAATAKTLVNTLLWYLGQKEEINIDQHYRMVNQMLEITNANKDFGWSATIIFEAVKLYYNEGNVVAQRFLSAEEQYKALIPCFNNLE